MAASLSYQKPDRAFTSERALPLLPAEHMLYNALTCFSTVSFLSSLLFVLLIEQNVMVQVPELCWSLALVVWGGWNGKSQGRPRRGRFILGVEENTERGGRFVSGLLHPCTIYMKSIGLSAFSSQRRQPRQQHAAWPKNGPMGRSLPLSTRKEMCRSDCSRPAQRNPVPACFATLDGLPSPSYASLTPLAASGFFCWVSLAAALIASTP